MFASADPPPLPQAAKVAAAPAAPTPANTLRRDRALLINFLISGESELSAANFLCRLALESWLVIGSLSLKSSIDARLWQNTRPRSACCRQYYVKKL